MHADKTDKAHYICCILLLCLCVGTVNFNDADKKETKGITGIFIYTQLLTHTTKQKNVVVYVGPLVNFTQVAPPFSTTAVFENSYECSSNPVN